jgi:hypothetical protein
VQLEHFILQYTAARIMSFTASGMRGISNGTQEILHDEHIWNIVPVSSKSIKDLTAKNGSQHASCLYRPQLYLWNN